MKSQVFHVKIEVMLKKEVLDPQGEAVVHALHALSFPEVTGVRVGKVIDVALHAQDETQAAQAAKRMCEQLLVNGVIEDYLLNVKSV